MVAHRVPSMRACRGRQLLSVAPMMDYTDGHFRYMARLLSRRTTLYSEMVVDKAIVHSDTPQRFLFNSLTQATGQDVREGDGGVVLQLGGNEVGTMARAAEMAASYGCWDEININCGCPSDKVAGAGAFGASLMRDPKTVAEVASAMRRDSGLPITVKCRLGVDDNDSYGELKNFIHTVASHGDVEAFQIHARKAILAGLSPAENRSIPPLHYRWVYALKEDFPELRFSLNGGVTSLEEVQGLLNAKEQALEGVMIGRAAYTSPWLLLANADTAIYGEEANPQVSRRAFLDSYALYATQIEERTREADALNNRKSRRHRNRNGPSLRTLVKPLLGMFYGEDGARRWKREVDSALHYATTFNQLIEDTIHVLSDKVLDAPPQRCGLTIAPDLADKKPHPSSRAGSDRSSDSGDGDAEKGSSSMCVHV